MAPTSSPQNDAAQIASSESDYGSEVDEITADILFSQAESLPLNSVVLDSIEEPAIIDDHGDDQPLARIARIRDNVSAAITGLTSPCPAFASQGLPREAAIEVEYDERNRDAFSPRPENGHNEREQSVSVEAQQPDTRTPLQRFRTWPKKPLSVTDIVSPAWCELQYFYNLSKYGRVRKTPAMKQGSSVHKVLEEQTLGPPVEIEVVTKEDRFGLRIWNIIQRLRTLRMTGMTRELEIWGLVDGEVVNGIIDEVNTQCPDAEAEAQMLEEADQAKDASNKGRKRKPLPADQRTLTDFLTTSPSSSVLENSSAWLGTLQEKPKALYIVDIKTRQSKTLPPVGSQLRPTQMQLMMYHRLFSTLAANGVLADRVFERYGVNSQVTFSDTFIAQIASLDAANVDVVPEGRQDAVDELVAHNTLASMWELMIIELSNAVQGTVSTLLTAEFRTPVEGTLIGRRSFAFDAGQLDVYVADEMRWWKGERETKGVDVEEAYKCRICTFANECSWRATKIEEGIQKARLRNGAKRKSEV